MARLTASGRRQERVVEIRLGGDEGVHDLARGRLRARGIRVPGDGHGSALEDVRRRKGQRQVAARDALELLVDDQVVETAVGLRVGPLGGERNQKRRAGEASVHGLAGQQAPQQPVAAGAGRVHVDMRIGAEDRHARRQRHHALGDVGVQVERVDHGDLPADDVAHPCENLALAVLEVIGHHGAVQVEKDRVEGTVASEILGQHAGDPLERVPGDKGRGFGRGPQQRHELVTVVAGGLDESLEAQVQTRDGIEHRRAPGQAGPCVVQFEIREGRDIRGEGVGLVLEAADGDACHGDLSPADARKTGMRAAHCCRDAVRLSCRVEIRRDAGSLPSAS